MLLSKPENENPWVCIIIVVEHVEHPEQPLQPYGTKNYSVVIVFIATSFYYLNFNYISMLINRKAPVIQSSLPVMSPLRFPIN